MFVYIRDGRCRYRHGSIGRHKIDMIGYGLKQTHGMITAHRHSAILREHSATQNGTRMHSGATKKNCTSAQNARRQHQVNGTYGIHTGMAQTARHGTARGEERIARRLRAKHRIAQPAQIDPQLL